MKKIQIVPANIRILFNGLLAVMYANTVKIFKGSMECTTKVKNQKIRIIIEVEAEDEKHFELLQRKLDNSIKKFDR